jgi:DNA-binding NtrC family response regulator
MCKGFAFGGKHMAELILRRAGDDTEILRCPLFGRTLNVGPSPANDLCLPESLAPPHLCAVVQDPSGKFRLLDRSGQGLEEGGAGKTERVLQDGDVFALGQLEALFRQEPSRATERNNPRRTGILFQDKKGRLSRRALRLLGGTLKEPMVIPDTGLRLGGDESNDVVVEDGFVSGFHAEIFWRGERIFVRDLDSTNGTRLSNIRIIEAEIPVPAKLEVGKTEFQIASEEVEEELEEVAGKGPWTLGELRTADEDFAALFRLIEKVAPHDATVCITGETGTGKELVARVIHEESGRAQGPFVALNCAAIPENLIESELFGHEKGAFTGADRRHLGAFEQANGGTLFLDEVGELTPAVQVKLLRALETRAIRRLGGRGEEVVDCRVLAATHRDLARQAESGEFRSDLFHRLYVIPVELPPLRQRPADIVHLAHHFARELSPDGQPTSLTALAERALCRHAFPGNVRELRNVIHRALILGDGEKIDGEDIQFAPTSLAQAMAAGKAHLPGMTMEEIEREAYRRALLTNENSAGAARSLGIPKTTFWRRAKQLGLADLMKGSA